MEGDYSEFSKEELIEKIRKLECHVKQLRNVICKREKSPASASQGNSKKRTKLEGLEEENGEQVSSPESPAAAASTRKKVQRPFDFSAVSKRHTALKILYLGWNYQGLASQEDTDETIEAHLFKALTLTRLIEDRSNSNYHRCGRTDKGVSAFSQVISIDLRSKMVDGVETLDYCKILNRTLPKEIRVIAWSPVRPEFSARFSCFKRTYRYFFPKANLNVQKMVESAQPLIGEHDFRNFCKYDKESSHSIRRIFSVDIIDPNNSAYDICQLVIVGRSFLWHQIRCIVALLILVGKELEEVDVIGKLLDLEAYPKKPQYSMAIDYPLVLYDVQYPDDENIKWTYTPENMTVLLGDLQYVWMQQSLKSAMLHEMIKDIEKCTEVKSTSALTDTLMMGSQRKMYVKLRDRPVCGGNDDDDDC